MPRKLYTPLLVALASAALLAGCGGSSKPPAPSTHKKTAPAKTTPATTKPAASTPSGTSPASAALTPAELKAAAAGCQTAVAHFPTAFGSAAKSDASKVCSDLASGNLTAARSDAQKYCADLISLLPAQYKSEAEAGCSAVKKEF
jgi:cytochrome c556